MSKPTPREVLEIIWQYKPFAYARMRELRRIRDADEAFSKIMLRVTRAVCRNFDESRAVLKTYILSSIQKAIWQYKEWKHGDLIYFDEIRDFHFLPEKETCGYSDQDLLNLWKLTRLHSCFRPLVLAVMENDSLTSAAEALGTSRQAVCHMVNSSLPSQLNLMDETEMPDDFVFDKSKLCTGDKILRKCPECGKVFLLDDRFTGVYKCVGCTNGPTFERALD